MAKYIWAVGHLGTSTTQMVDYVY